MELGWFLFLGYWQTDTISESSYGNMSVHKKFQPEAQNVLAVDCNMHTWLTGMHVGLKAFFEPDWGSLDHRDGNNGR